MQRRTLAALIGGLVITLGVVLLALARYVPVEALTETILFIGVMVVITLFGTVALLGR